MKNDISVSFAKTGSGQTDRTLRQTEGVCFRRLLLAEIYRAGDLPLSEDLMMSILEQLQSAKDHSPFASAGRQALPAHFATFAWHR